MKFFHRLRTQFRKQELDQELSEELAFHIQKETEENIAAGMNAEEARFAALRKFGGVEQVKEECRDAWGVRFIDTVLQDLRYGVRMLAKSPGFTTVAVLTLALGIGATTAIFSMVNSVLLRPLAYREAQQLYLVREIIPELSRTYPTLPANVPNFRVWQRQCHSFAGIAIVTPMDMTLTGYGGAEQIAGARVSANLFDVLGIVPKLGRTFVPEEDNPGHDHVVMLTDSF